MIKIEEIKNKGLEVTLDCKDINSLIIEMVSLTCGFMQNVPQYLLPCASNLLTSAIEKPSETLESCKVMKDLLQHLEGDLSKIFPDKFK